MVTVDVIINILVTVVNYVMECTVEKSAKGSGECSHEMERPYTQSFKRKVSSAQVPCLLTVQ